MIAPYDIFESEASGDVLWLGSAATLEDAKACVEEIAVRSASEYLLLNQATGNKFVIRFDEKD
jgi:hypothetical protein